MELHLVFVDLYKAFHSINQNFMLKTLRKEGVHAKIINLLAKMYGNDQA